MIDPVIAQLHAAFVRISQREEPVRLFTLLWSRLLASEEYQGDSAALQRDACFVARYLVGQIQRDRRNPGALRLRNVLQEEQFLADRAEAKQQNPKAYAALCRARVCDASENSCRPGASPGATSPSAPDEAIRTETAASLRSLREQLAGLTAEEVEKLKSANAQKQLPGS